MAALQGIDGLKAPAGRKRFAFIFPMASGHINASFPIARSLVDAGHEVHYLCHANMRHAVVGTGAVFHSVTEQQPELYEGREAENWGAFGSLRKEYDMESGSLLVSAFKLMAVQVELMLPGTLRWLRSLRPSVVMFCPVMNSEAVLAAKILGIPSIALLTLAGAGGVALLLDEVLRKTGLTPSAVEMEQNSYEPNLTAIRRLNAQYGLNLTPLSFAWVAPLGHLKLLADVSATIVTTSEALQDPVSEELAAAYEADGVSMVFVGPCLDRPGAARAGTHKYVGAAEGEGQGCADPVELVRAARRAGRRVVLASMGTIITGDHKQFGWNGRLPGPGGSPRGLSGCQLSRAVWAGVFDALGASSAASGALILVAVGPQPDPLGECAAPANAQCAPTMPQVDVLRVGVDAFVTHGGQNSFMEALAHATPVVICPGFGDQITNAHKAADLGVGLMVDRPDPDEGEEAAAMARFGLDVRDALLRVLGEPAFRANAERYAEQLRAAGGVPRATEIVLTVAQAASPALAESWKHPRDRVSCSDTQGLCASMAGA